MPAQRLTDTLLLDTQNLQDQKDSSLEAQYLSEVVPMTMPACPYCGSSPLLQSPSGQHLLCVKCNRVLMQPRIKKPRGKRAKNQNVPAKAYLKSISEMAHR